MQRHNGNVLDVKAAALHNEEGREYRRGVKARPRELGEINWDIPALTEMSDTGKLYAVVIRCTRSVYRA